MGSTRRTKLRLWGTFALLAAAAASESGAQPPRIISCGGSSPAAGYYTITPCRVIDTRDTSTPLGYYAPRQIVIAGSCGIPGDAVAVSFNFTAIDGGIDGGSIAAYEPGIGAPSTSAISYPATTARANNGVYKVAAGSLVFENRANRFGGTVHLIVDVNGYFKE